MMTCKALSLPWSFFWSPNFANQVERKEKGNVMGPHNQIPHGPAKKSILRLEEEIRKAVNEIFGNLIEDYPLYCYVATGIPAPKKLKFSARGKKTILYICQRPTVTARTLVFTRERAHTELLTCACKQPHLVTGVAVYRII